MKIDAFERILQIIIRHSSRCANNVVDVPTILRKLQNISILNTNASQRISIMESRVLLIFAKALKCRIFGDNNRVANGLLLLAPLALAA